MNLGSREMLAAASVVAALAEDSCQTAPFLGNTITLKPSEKRSFSVLPATCLVSYGITGRQWTYDVTTSDAADGASLATTVSVLRQRTGI